jgi:uncharacterized protein (TIGR00251 family)
MDAAWYRIDSIKQVVSLTVHAQPGAKHTAIAGLHDGALKIRIAEPAIDGKANIALLEFVAQLFAVPARNVTLKQGVGARRKLVEIYGSVRDPATLLETTG